MSNSEEDKLPWLRVQQVKGEIWEYYPWPMAPINKSNILGRFVQEQEAQAGYEGAKMLSDLDKEIKRWFSEEDWPPKYNEKEALKFVVVLQKAIQKLKEFTDGE